MEPDWPSARSPSARETWARAVVPVARALRADSHDASIGMLDRIGANLPELVADPDDAETNRASNEANILLIAELLERGADPTKARPPTQTIAYAEIGAHQNTPLTGLLRAYRIGHMYVWERILELLREQVDDQAGFAEAVSLVSTWLHVFADTIVCVGEEVYVQERERWMRTSAALRAETIASIVAGEPTASETASARLGYELERDHVALVAWLDGAEGTADPLTALERALGALAAHLSSSRPLVHPLGLATTAAWVGSREAIDVHPLQVEGAGTDSAAVRVAVGRPGTGVEGFRRSHFEAMHARRVATLAALGPGITFYSDVALIALATADLDQARMFMGLQLGPLGADDETMRRLVTTARAYLDEGASHGRAAQRLGIHENTVRYRIRQVEDLLERSIRPADLDLHVALALAEAAPPLSFELR